MKKIFILVCVFSTLGTFAQKKEKEREIPKYRRSSLHLMMMQDAKVLHKNIIINAFENAPFPAKYDQHDIGVSSYDFLNIKMPEIERSTEEASDKEEDAEDKRLKGADKKIEKYFADEGIAKKLVALWFNRQEDGSMDMNLIAKRGSYDATSLDVSIAKMDVKTVSSQMKDAGKELIGNTFIVVDKINFYSNETAAALIYEASKIAIAVMKEENAMQTMAKKAATVAAEALYERTRAGYTVRTDAFLYKLVWNDTIFKVFRDEHAVRPNWDDETKKQKALAFDNSDLYSMELVGMQKSTVMVLNLKSGNMTEEQIISEATIRTVDKVFAKLQKEYDVFKPKSPLFQVEKKLCTAKIGMKEGLEGGEKFEVLEQLVDETGLTTYKKVGTIKVDKKSIWNNLYSATTEAPKTEGDEVIISATSFKGCKAKKHYPGQLIRQVK